MPIYGTMAHSYVQAHADESAAFAAFARAQPENAILLIDTYDTERAAHKVVAARAARSPPRGSRSAGVRIDSGDLAEHARRVRAILDAGGSHGSDDLRERRTSTSSGCATCSRAARRSTASASARA